MSLIGTKVDHIQALRLAGDEVRWQLYDNAQWNLEGHHTTTGTGAFRSVGWASGIAIDERGTQKFAELEIYEYTETHGGVEWGGPFAEYRFLQRPRDWPALKPRGRREATLNNRSDWATIPQAGIKLRLTSTGHLRTDSPFTSETELIEVPGVEMRPTGPGDSADFFAKADVLWFALRVLLTFWTDQYIHPAAELLCEPKVYRRVWRVVSIEPKPQHAAWQTPSLSGPLRKFLASGAASLMSMNDQRGLLHAAALGYANSHQAPNFEAGITSCVEAIERLVGLIEPRMNLSREVVSPREWRALSRELRKVIDSSTLPSSTAQRVKRSLSSPVNLTLEERILRVAKVQNRWWSISDRKLLEGLRDLIHTRNDIVHGRLANDSEHTYVQLLRAQAIFQVMFLGLLKCRLVKRDGRADVAILQHQHLLTLAHEDDS